MPLLTHEDFVGSISIAQIDTEPVFELLQTFINSREPEILIDLFGIDGYRNLILMDKSILSSVQMQAGSLFNDGVFYANILISEWMKIHQHNDDIYIDNLANQLIAKSADITSDYPKLSDVLRNHDISGSSGVWMVLDVFNSSGDLGSVFINSNLDVRLSNPSAWPAPINTIDDLYNNSLNVDIKAFGFAIDADSGHQRIKSLLFNGDLYSFASAEYSELVLKTAKKIAAHFIWYWYSRNKQTLTTSSGEMRQKSENSEPAGQADKQAMVWNEMSRMIKYIGIKRHHCLINGKYAPINDLNF